MDWTAPVDAYCERLHPGFWAEPLNALTNLAYLAVGVVMLARARRAGDGGAVVLSILLCAIAVGSFLFHTVAQRWAGLADVLPITAFIIAYVFLACRRFLGLPVAAAALAAALVPPFSAAVAWALRAALGGLGGSEGYLGTLMLFAAFALALARRDPPLARMIGAGGAILAVSILARSIDGAVCAIFPPGTHFLWHLLNAAMFWVMIPLIMSRRATLAQATVRG